MFFQKDYIMRMIEMMGDFMRRIGELIDDLQKMRMLGDAMKKYCGMDLEAAEKLSPESLIDLLSPQPRLMMSEILYVQANTVRRLSPGEKDQLLLKAVKLLLSLRDESLLCELRYQRLEECMHAVAQHLTAQDYLDAAAFMVEAEQFAKGEDALYKAIDMADGDLYLSVLQQGIALMEKCFAYPDERLILGGLPRDEVVESIATLKAKLNQAEARI